MLLSLLMAWLDSDECDSNVKKSYNNTVFYCFYKSRAYESAFCLLI